MTGDLGSPDAMATDRPGELVRRLRTRLATPGLGAAAAAQVRLDLGRALYSQSRWTDASRELGALIATPELPRAIRVQALGVLAGALVLSERADEGVRAAEEVMASPDADPESRVLAHSAIRGVVFYQGRYEAAVAEAREIVAGAAAAGPVGRGEARIDMGGMLMHADEFDEARRWLALDPDAPEHQRGEALESVAFIDLLSGRFSDVLEGLRPEVTDGHGTDRPDFRQGNRRGLRANALLHLDRLEEAARELEDIPIHVRSPYTAVATAALLAEARDGGPAAVGHVERIVARAAREAEARPRLRIWGPELVRIAVAGGDETSATWIVEALSEATRQTEVASVHAGALLAAGILNRDEDRLRGAVEAFVRGPRVFALAQAAEALGVLQLERGSAAEAVASLKEAWRVYASTDAERDVRRLARVLAGLGVRTGRSGPRGGRGAGWESLSPTERTIASLIAEGMSNPEIAERLVVSRRTVESHVGHVLLKLDVRSRSGISRFLSDRAARGPR